MDAPDDTAKPLPSVNLVDAKVSADADAPLVPRPPSQPPPRRSERPSARPGGPNSLVDKMLSGRYRIVRLLGAGAMGAVYEAEHVHMRKRLAVKVLHAEMSRLPEIVTRFEREAMAAGNIDHPNVAAASDFGKLDDGSFFLVLEYVVGKNLRDALGAGRFELGRALHITRQIASALDRAHALGIVHRDLKPENLMLVERDGDPDFVKVLDFGIAKVPVGDLPGEQATTSNSPALTRMGMIFGTPEYMAPEQATGQAVDGRADLYSLGILMFEMLTGVRPFDHENAATLLIMQVTAPVPSLASTAPGANVPPTVEALLGRLLAKEASQRFASASELVAALAQIMVDLSAVGRLDPRLLNLGSLASVRMKAFSDASSPTQYAIASLEPTSHTSSSPLVNGLHAFWTRIMAVARRGAMGIPHRAWLAAGSIAVVLLIWRLVGGTRTVAPEHPVTTASELPHPVPPDHALAEQVAAAEAILERADYAGAIAELTRLEQVHPDSAVIHHDLERAHMGAGDVKGALLEAKVWLSSDLTTSRDSKFEEDVRAAALGSNDPDDAFALLETNMGAVGADILYDIGYGPGHTSAADRARAALGEASVRKNASAALAITLDLRSARSCDGKKALFERAREVADARTLAVLKGYKSTSGCGFLSRRDCWPCMHRDGSLAEVLDVVEARTGKP